MTFSELNLDSTIAKALNACGYKNPTPIQRQSIPNILDGKDLVASAQTGTGKTAAFVLPALHRITQAQSGKKPRILILTPTRELATQITDAIGKYGKFLRFTMVSLIGGMRYDKQLRGLSAKSIDIVVATPGRLLDHMQNRKIDLSAIEMLILDEADRMLDMGFIDDVKTIAKATPNTRQTLLFSATVDKRLGNIISQLLNNPTRIDLSQEKMAPTKIKQELYIADNIQHKNNLLKHFLAETSVFKAIIFSATKINADKLAKELRDQGYEAAALHGDLKQGVRNKTIEQLRRGKIQFLVATDVAARGLDINDITHVINFDLPKFSEDYVHRIGRTGRAGRSGIAISLALPNEARHLQKIEHYVGEKIALSTVDGLEPRQGFSAAPSKKKRSSGHKSHFKKKSNSGAHFSERSPSESRNGYARKSRSEPGAHFSERSPSEARGGYARKSRSEPGAHFSERSPSESRNGYAKKTRPGSGFNSKTKSESHSGFGGKTKINGKSGGFKKPRASH